jgi:hypothetical protein
VARGTPDSDGIGARAAAAAIALNAFAVVTVNFWIYHSRIVFSERHPDYVAVDPPTISRAISDNSIGDPFALWITLSAVALVLCYLVLARLYLRTAALLRPAAPGTARALTVGVALMMLFRLGASAGMVILSWYRFPDHNAAHMAGSYLFFTSEALAALTGATLTTLAGRALRRHPGLGRQSAIRPAGIRFRPWLGFAAAGMAVLYLGLFLLKDVDLPGWNGAVMQTYVWMELALISMFLAHFSLYQVELWAVIRRGRRARRAAAGQAPQDT